MSQDMWDILVQGILVYYLFLVWVVPYLESFSVAEKSPKGFQAALLKVEANGIHLIANFNRQSLALGLRGNQRRLKATLEKAQCRCWLANSSKNQPPWLTLRVEEVAIGWDVVTLSFRDAGANNHFSLLEMIIATDVVAIDPRSIS